MEKGNHEIKVEFKEFLDKCTNLISLFGIFNALLIYSFSIQDSDIDQFLIPPFLVLSLFVWYHLILFTLKSSDGSRNYHIFFGLICMVQIGLLILFVKKLASLLLFLLTASIYFGFIWILVLFFGWIFTKCGSKKWHQSLTDKKINNVTFIIMFVSIISSGIMLHILASYISEDSREFIKQLVDRLESKEYSIFPVK